MRYARHENQFLVECMRAFLDPSATGYLNVLHEQTLDWNYVIQIAQRNGVQFMLYEVLCKSPEGEFPDAVQKTLKDLADNNLRKNMFMKAELIRILRLLTAASIPVMPLKGPVWTELIYGTLSVRLIGDLDILVNKQDISRAKKIMIDAGYTDLLRVAPEDDEWVIRQGWRYHFGFARHDANLLVEMHWALGHKDTCRLCSPELLWGNAETMPLHGIQILRPSTEDMLIFLCAHGYKHHWNRLSWLCDIARVLYMNPTLDWNRIFERAANNHCTRVLLVNLYILNEIFGYPLPDAVVRDPKLMALANRICGQLEQYLFSTTVSIPRSDLSVTLAQCSLRETTSERLRYLYRTYGFHVRPNERDREFVRLPDSLFVLYYAARPVRLLRDFTRKIRG